MDDWLNEFFGLTNLTGMHDEDEIEEQPKQFYKPRKGPQQEKVLKRTYADDSSPVDPIKSPLLYKLWLYQQSSDQSKYKDGYKELQFILIKSDYSTMIIDDIHKLDIPSLGNDLIGIVRGSQAYWSADYLTVPEGKLAHRSGYHSSQQAINHMIVIHKSGVG